MKQFYFLKFYLIKFIFLFVGQAFYAQAPAYYNSTDLNKTASALKDELANLIINTHRNELSYTPGVWEALQQTDLDPTNSNNVLLIYGSDDNDNNFITDRSRNKNSNGGNSGTDWNREHTYPRSLGNPNLGSEGPGSDAHHLRASDVQLNGDRGNLPFENDINGGAAHRVSNSWYPGDEWKGDVARMMMYMYLRYGDRCNPNTVGVSANTFSNDMPDIFLQWNVDDPVSEFELQRNPILERIQGNRNPFIDNPAFATSIWGGPQAENRFNPIVLINEIDVDTPGEDTLEFIELYDGGFGNTSLDGIIVVLYNGSNDQSYLTINLNGHQTDENGYFVIGSAAVTNVDLPVINTIGIQNGADAVALYASNPSNFPNGTAVTNQNLIDAIVYDTDDADDAILIAILTPDELQINENQNSKKDQESIQRLPNGSGGLKSTSTYGTALPTPGETNDIPDTVAPSTPTNLTAANISSNSVDLSWDPATDNNGIKNYRLFQNSIEIAMVTATEFTVEGLLASTEYGFTVLSEDPSGNQSPQSSELRITTLENQNSAELNGLVAQSFESNETDTWAYNITPEQCNQSGDVWAVVGSVGSINTASEGASFFGVQDLKGNCGTSEGGTIAMETVDVSGYNTIKLHFDYNIVGFDVDNGDIVNYVLSLDGVSQDPIQITDVQGFTTNGWETITINIPDGTENLALAIHVKQDGGSDYAGFDAFKITGNAKVKSPKLLINEIDADTEGTDTLEFIELFDGGTGATSLDGYAIVLFNGSNDLSYSTINLSGYSTDENGYFVIGTNDVINVDLPAFDKIGLQNGADAVALYLADHTDFPSGSVATSENLIDAVVYGTSDPDATNLLAVLTPEQLQLDENANGNKDTESSQRFPNGSGDLRATTTYRQLVPTPGKSNGGENSTDTEAPTPPSNLSALNTTSNSVELNWEASSDNIGVVSYRIFQDNVELASTTGVNYTVENLEPTKAYKFTVVALDAANNVSNSSNELVVTTLEADVVSSINSALIITAVFDGPLSGGTPKGVELFAKQDILDLSEYGLGSANNGGGTDGQEFTFPAESVASGTYIYIATDIEGFNTYFGFEPNYISDALAVNGDDAVELFYNNTVVDLFGDINTDGTGQDWEYTDGFAYRKDTTGPDGSNFNIDHWTFSGINALDNTTTNSTIPVGTYSFTPPVPLLITTVFDGPLSGGTPKGVELFVKHNIADLSSFGIGSANNGGGSDGQEFTFPAISVVAGTYLYVASEAEQFSNYFGFNPNFTDSAIGINGDDAIELFQDGTVIDTFGDINTDGTGQNWDYTDGFAYRVKKTGPDAALFKVENWVFSNPDALDNTTSNTQIPIAKYNEEDTEILEITPITDARNLADGSEVRVTGTLTVSDQFAGSAYLQDQTAAIAVFDNQVHGNMNFKIGDSITITATRSSFNNQIQLSAITAIEAHGKANNPIVPKTILLSELSNYPGQLVKIKDVNFPNPNQLLFGNSNYVLTTADGSAELRIDGDVKPLVGLAQPDSCNELIGVIGRFMDFYQIIPRLREDLGCAETYETDADNNTIPKAETLDVVTWNIEWFGDETNSPARANADTVQKEAVKSTLLDLDADIIAVQEIADSALFSELVSELNGYSFVLSSATSYPDDTVNPRQQVGFIYKTEVITPLNSEPLFLNDHPYYNGGSSATISDFPDADKTRFFASGRLPFVMTANVTLNGTTEQIDFVVLHARANGSFDSESRYTMRKYDVEFLKRALDAQYKDNNLILLGDYNDDVDVTVADNVSTTLSTYESYVSDNENYSVISASLSDDGFRSYVFRENMIDHIMISDELFDNYIASSVDVGYQYYNSEYTSTTSDHFPVVARFKLNAPLTITNLDLTNVSCFNANDGSASITVSGGVQPYSYNWSNGETTNEISNLSAGTYTLTVSDAANQSVERTFEITQPEEIKVTITENNNITNTDLVVNCISIGIVSSNETEDNPYSYLWNTGETTKTISVCPEVSTSYSLTIMNKASCSETKTIAVTVENKLTPLILESLDVVHVSCFNANDGAASITVSGGVQPYSYNWSNGETTNEISKLSAGTYSVTVSDAADQTVEKTFEINQPKEIKVTITENNNITNTDLEVNCISIGIVSSNETEDNPYSYLWNTGETAQTISVCPEVSTSYSLTITNRFSCSETKTIAVTVENKSTPLIVESLDVVNVSCFNANDGAASVTVSGGSPPYQYNWSNGETLHAVSNLSVGTYTVRVTDQADQSIEKTIVVSQPEDIRVALTENPRVLTSVLGKSCATIKVESSNETAENQYSYLWSTGDQSETITVCPDQTTDYTVTITNSNGCSITKTVTVTVEDIRCSPFKIQMCLNNRPICVPFWFVRWYESLGAVKGSCLTSNQVEISALRVYPNPFKHTFYTRFNSNKAAKIDFVIYNQSGVLMSRTSINATVGINYARFNMYREASGFYYLTLVIDGEVKQTKKVYKY